MNKGLTFIETKGDVHFYKNAKGIQYQQLGVSEPYKVRDGSITHKHITNVLGLEIKYNNNGVYGFSVWKGKTNLEDNIWKFNDAERIARELAK